MTDSFYKDGLDQHLPLLDEMNYSYWKAHMKTFIKSKDEKAWRAILAS